MTTVDIREQISLAISACEDKKAENLRLLQLDKDSSAFTDFFLICSGTNPRQVQAISDEVELRLKRAGNYANQIEGFNQAEWVLLDYVDFVVHVFSENARKYYDLERLWKSAKQLTRDELLAARAQVSNAVSAAEPRPSSPRKAAAVRSQAPGKKKKSKSAVASILRRKPAKKSASKKKQSSTKPRRKKN